MRYLFGLLILVSVNCTAQTISAAQQKALNSYVDYANQSVLEVEAVVKSLASYYPSIHQKRSWGAPRYVCPVQMEEYYLNNVQNLSKSLSATYATPLNSKLRGLRNAAEAIDLKCKELDTYHKLEDYKQDNFAKAETIVVALQQLVADYQKKQVALQAELETVYHKLSTGQTANHKTDAAMRAALVQERALLDSWTLNLKEEIHTGWSVDKLEKSIVDTDTRLKAMEQAKPVLKYPASSMWPSFRENMAVVQDIKRSGLDGYNFEAKKSDKHSNDVYLSLINYYNGALIADYNAFIDFALGDGYLGLKYIKYAMAFEIRSDAKETTIEVKPFTDIPYVPVTMAAQKTVIPKTVFAGLSTYIEFINETWRQTRYLNMVLSNFSSSAAYYKTLDSYEKRGAMSFEYKDFALPLSYHQKVMAESKALPPAVASTLNNQATVLLDILKEMDNLSASLQMEVKERRYEKDRLARVYQILERQKVLYDTWDDKKEQLYNDIRKVNDAYAPTLPTSSWYVAGKALQRLTDLDHEALFAARAHYRGNTVTSINTEKIDETLREVIANEFTNMKGIEKIGRNNGNCPYTPYEDLPATSKSFSEEVKKLKPVNNDGRYDHPYYRILYYYNDIVDDYNKFCELSKTVPHLMTIKQPELFTVKYPTAKDNTVKPVAEQKPPVVAEVKKEEVKKTDTPPKSETKKKDKQAEQSKQDGPVHTTEKIATHDTVYIERRDTVYIAEPGENLRSMEGYATNNMILLLDVSGSMNSPEKLPLLKKSVMDLLSMMRQEDEVSIIAFSGKPKVLLEGASFKEEDKIKKAINDLKSSGKTDGNAGVKLAYEVADENYIRGGNNRIILATDGEFALNDEVRQLIEKFSKEDIFLSVFNFGKGMGSSKALENLSSLGKGNYSYISQANVDIRLIREAKAKRRK